MSLNLTPRRLFKKGQLIRKKLRKQLQSNELPKVLKQIEYDNVNPQSRQLNRRSPASSTIKGSLKLSNELINKTCDNFKQERRIIISDLDKVKFVEYSADPILSQRKSFMIRYKKNFRCP